MRHANRFVSPYQPLIRGCFCLYYMFFVLITSGLMSCRFFVALTRIYFFDDKFVWLLVSLIIFFQSSLYVKL